MRRAPARGREGAERVDKRERMAAAIAGEQADRIPCGFWHHFDAAQAFGEASVQAHVRFCEETDADVLKVMNEHMYRLEQEIPISVAGSGRTYAFVLRGDFEQGFTLSPLE